MADARRRHSIENAYYDHNYDVFQAELDKLLADKARLDYLESLKARTEQRTLGEHRWEAFHYQTGTNTPSVRDQIDSERT